MTDSQPRLVDDTTLNVALCVDDTEAEGPGRRMAVWVQGCPFRCPGCCNPHMLDDIEKESVAVQTLLDRLEGLAVEGISLLGGEPFSQAPALARLAMGAQRRGKSVMVFSGYTNAELRADSRRGVADLLAATDILVDGRYQKENHSSARRWIGSSNQTLHFLSDRYSKDDPQFSDANTVELRMSGDTLTLNGWPVDGSQTFPTLKRPRPRQPSLNDEHRRQSTTVRERGEG